MIILEHYNDSVGITGSTQSGKTKAKGYILSELPDTRIKVAVGDEQAIRCPHPLNEKSGFQAQLWILHQQMDLEYVLRSNFRTSIFDRTTYDSIVYCNYLLEHGQMNQAERDLIFNFVSEWVNKFPYSALIYLEPVPNKYTKLSFERLKFQQDIDKLFVELFENKKLFDGVDVYTIPFYESKQRNAVILEIVQRYIPEHE